MRNALEDIVSRLRHDDYKNEEHVRIAIALRLLDALGWDIWNPIEVYSEFSAIPSEDASRVDLAIFMPPHYLRPALFIEVKAVGKLATAIDQAERQLRDYNRNNQAEISVLTDGQEWRFYLASASGEFSQKCFEKFDLLSENCALDDVELALDAFLSKAALQSGKAVEEARLYLKRTDAQRIMFDVLPIAQRDAQEDPLKSLVECFVSRCSERGVSCALEDASVFIRHNLHRAFTGLPSGTVSSGQPSAHPERTAPHGAAQSSSRTSQSNGLSGLLFLSGRRGTNAKGKALPSGRFVVLEGSIAAEASPGFMKDDRGYYPLYRDLLNQKKFVRENKGGVAVFRLTEDTEFRSISAAASVFLGTSASGPREWKQKQS
ncbi:MAG: DUF4357 domain-containing protein [Delftia acidovorans]|nr:DUF4357 domain-containing protein [Delftia acidovorans]